MPHPRRRELAVGKTISIQIELNEIVEVWRGGDWQCLIPSESLEMIRKREAHVRSFVISSNRGSYDIDLDSMTRKDHLSGRTRAIRFTHVEGLQDSGNWDFDKCKDFFTDMASGNAESEPLLTQDDLLCKWPGAVMDGDLLGETVREVMRSASLRDLAGLTKEEWVNYWALQVGEPSAASVAELTERLRVVLQYDSKVLERLQAIFEAFATAILGRNSLALPIDGLLEACRTMEAFPDHVMEKFWAQDILRQHDEGKLALEEDEELNYHDFMSVMLGRKRQKVYLLMYDITDGRASFWSWLLGPHFRAFWHTGVMVEFADKPGEFWFGGKVFLSTPCTTPFGEPVEKRFMGYTYRSREEVIHHIGVNFAHEFHKDSYDALTHNCNHFSDKLMMYLANEHVPEEILKQPELILNSPAVQLARPFLNRRFFVQGS
ncbi:desi1 [Symbiodinium pilosum]|uniref:Desi1 protein n=1 Tax=Symbiodinium pilosum TaxID=2952 RepID=A0A812UAV3_SYMPI|nr:desi1 [Symbiodinium pilosum]